MNFYRLAALLMAISLQPLAANGQSTDELPAAQRVEQLARRYRILTYNTFHDDRPQYDRHRAALRNTLDAWRAAGSHGDDVERLVIWLQQATKAFKNNPRGPLPAGLEFEARISRKPTPTLVPTLVPAPVAKIPAHPPAAQQQTVLRPVLPKATDIPKTIPAPKPTPPEPTPPKPTPPKPTPPEPTPPKPTPPKPTPPKPILPKPTPPKPIPPKPTPPKPTPPKPTPVGRDIVKLPTLPGFDGVTKSPSPMKVRPPKRVAPKKAPYRRRATAKASKPPVKHLASRPKRPAASINTARRPARPSPQRTTGGRTAASVPRGKKPFAQAQPSLALPVLSPAKLAGLGKAKSADIRDNADSDINLIELAAQIAGTNMAFRGVETQLSQSQSWDTVQLTPMVQVLKQLSARRDDLTLFRDLLPESDRRLVGQLESPRLAVSQCSVRISETRTRVKSKSFRGKPKEREAELKKLDELSRNLAELVAGY